MIDQNALPFGGGIMIAGILYAAFFWGVGGQTIGQRTIERSGWLPHCERVVVEHAHDTKPDLQFSAPTPDCNAVMGMFAGQDGKALCNVVGGLFENPLASQIKIQNKRLVEAYTKRLENAASNANSRCTCAINVQLQNRTLWGLYSGSFRIVIPSEIKNLNAELFTALNSPVCRGEFQ
ncbi:hypothetical protein [Pararhizobium sp. IMCC21322]|uniref:hypothetical protein n=1 Tax=Pararhizobium sp. IMCC21322 TaxID=3067903 RepID=UPI002741C92A|nr:hypothetical protein [Pararhizobium sp. IMCC21322]